MPPSPTEPTVILGPLLFFRGEQGERWRVSALFVLDGEAEPDDLGADGVRLPIPPRHMARWRGRHVWRFDFAVPRQGTASTVGYGFGTDRRWRFEVPGHDGRLSIAFTSCNGVAHETELARHPAPRNALWAGLLRRHAEAPFHLLLQGGDQLYADAVWQECPTLAAWTRERAPGRYAKPFTAAMAEEAMDFYFDRYLASWTQAEVAEALSRIPSVMMWDDHDLFDGYGSHPEPAHSAAVPRGVGLAARRAFTLFQLGGTADALPEGVWGAPLGTFSTGFRMGTVGLLAPDLRSERTPRRVLSERSWAELPRWLERFAECRHLLLLSTVPLLYPDTGKVERWFERFGLRTRFADDFRDQWRSHAHRAEWRRLLALLSGFSRRTGCRITVLSGEVHTGWHGLYSAAGVEIRQLIASGIVHPPPGRGTGWALERLGRSVERLGDGATLAMLPFAESGRRVLRQRNWLALDLTREAAEATWHAEGEPALYRLSL